MPAVLAGGLGGPPVFPGYAYTALRFLYTAGQPGIGRSYAHGVGEPLTEAERAVHGWVVGVDVVAL